MKLSELPRDMPVAIQCHDAPDADALASGFALFCYFRSLGLKPLLFYGGKKPISKPSLRIMVEKLRIPVFHAPEISEWDGLLITVDCQYGSNNVQKLRAGTVAVIDHHPPGKELPELHVVKPQLGSCSTLVWSMLQDEGFVIGPKLRSLAIALYYGLYSDTNGFAEARHPLDLNMRDALTFHDPHKAIQEERILRTLFTSNLSLDDLDIAISALHNIHVDRERRFALAGARPCDQNLLGFISDLAIQVAGIDLVAAWTPQSSGYKFSVRSSSRLSSASDVTAWLTAKGAGSGGGHKDKAGGWLKDSAVANPGSSGRQASPLCLRGGAPGAAASDPVLDYFRQALCNYHEAHTVIDRHCPPELYRAHMRPHVKKEIIVGYVPSSPLFPPGTRLQLRMLEGDAMITASENLYIVVGIQGEVHFTNRADFEAAYTPLPGIRGSYRPAFAPEYMPTVSPATSGEVLQLMQYLSRCKSRADAAPVLASQLEGKVKVFPAWDEDNYLLGDKGDWLLMRKDRPDELWVVGQRVFPVLYAPA
ncbi:DHH family phosphoesterase [Desulfovibrio sp. OttesenSCG-928-A18]|nr:DHH family phosphoesterase [Desulfovibrio sp. OttesenSCG-928-A18]